MTTPKSEESERSPGGMQARAFGLLTAGVGGVAFLVLAWWLVPWQPLPSGADLPGVGDYFTAEQIQRAESFSRWARVWSWGSLAVSLLVAGVLGFSRLGRRLMRLLPGPWWCRVPLGVLALVAIGRVITLPFAVAMRLHRLDHGLSTQSWSGFWRDMLVSQGINVVVTSLGLLLVVGCARRWRRAWPAVVAGALGLLVMLGSWVYPVVVEPLFNDFESLPEGELRTAVLALAETEGVELQDVLVADASRRTTTLNAYVSGLGATRRVVLYDNLVNDLPQDQALSVIAHELAHAKHDDVLVGSLLGAVGTVFAIGLLGVLIGGRRSRPDGSSTEDRGPSGVGQRAMVETPVVVPLLMALLAFGSLLSAPVQNGISRQVEARADREALAATGDADGFLEMQVQLALRSLADPTPPVWSQWWFGSHPTVLERAAIAREIAAADGDLTERQDDAGQGPSQE